MGEKKASIINYAMHFGAILGLFWALKYMVFVGANYWEPFIYLYYLLNAGTFLLIYIFYFKYRDSVEGTPKTMLQCIAFVVLLCFCASFFEGIMMYAHFQFIDPLYYSMKIEPALQGMVESFPYPPDVKASAMNICSNKIFYIFSTFVGNTFLGGVIGALLAVIVGNKKRNNL